LLGPENHHLGALQEAVGGMGGQKQGCGDGNAHGTVL